MRRLAVAVGAVLVLAVGGVAWAAIPNADGNIYACYNTGDGSVRVKEDPAKACAKGWAPLQWSAGQPHVPVTTTYIKSEDDVAESNFANGLTTIMCETGDVAVSGGVSMPFESRPHLKFARSFPESRDRVKPSGWSIDLDHTTGQADSYTAYAICQHTE